MAGPAYTRMLVDDRRRQLLELGAELFATHSYSELSMARIAREAGISKALLYHYFPSKQRFFAPRSSRERRRSRGGRSPTRTFPRPRRSPAASTPSSGGSRRTRPPTAR